MTPTAEQQSQGAQALDEARTLRQNGERPSAVVEKLRQGIASDPTNHHLFYELGRVSDVGRQMDDADECVCQVAPESPECRKVEKARGR
jgi:cytochrome c-type biogenesis protein CcmH/NrfG